MLDLVFGPHRSVQRTACIVLAGVVIVLGAVLVPSEGVTRGLSISLVGLLAGAVLAHLAEHRAATKASGELLGHVTAEMDEDNLRRMVDQARTSSAPHLPVVGEGAADVADLRSLPFVDDQAAEG